MTATLHYTRPLTRTQKIESLFPLARILACKWQTFFDKSALDTDDMISIAMMACVEAVDTHDAARGAKLDTHATLVIHRRLIDAHACARPETRKENARAAFIEVRSLDAMLHGGPCGLQDGLDADVLFSRKTRSTLTDCYPDVTDQVHTQINHDLDRAQIDAFMPYLSANERRAIEHFLTHDDNYEQAALALGKSRQQIDNILSRARPKLYWLAAQIAQGRGLPTAQGWLHRAKSVPRRIKKVTITN